jgi:cytochrome c5
MKFSFGKSAFWLAVLTAASVAVALGQGGATATSQGAAILERSCNNCHAADVIATYHHESADGYREIINSMVAAGAQISPQEIPVLAEYLFATHGKKPQGGAAAPSASAGPDPGKAILEAACTTCHGLDVIASHVYDTKEPYETVVRNMIGYGATVIDAQIPPLVDYMLKTYGKKPAAAAAATPDPGKAILEAACTTCHGLDGLANHAYTSKEPYESLIRTMIDYGATVRDTQIPPLVEYMFKTYGKK